MRPADVEVRALSGDGFWAAGLFEEAEGIYRDILATDPSSPGARAGLSRSLATRGKLEQGLAEIRAALATDDTQPEFHHTLGTIYRRLNRYQEASDALQRHVDLLPTVRRGERAEWARAEIRFLRSFGDRVPLELEGDPEAVHTIPFRLVNDKIIVRVRINGDGPFDLSIDTGAEQMVLSKETAQEVRVRPIANTISAGVGDVGVRGLDLGRVDVIEVGSLVMRNLPVIIKNPPLTDLPSKRELDSLSPLALGLSAVIDYRNHHLILARHLADEPADIEMPMRFHRLAVVRGVVNQEHPKSFVVDTGGEVISISLGTATDLDMDASASHPAAGIRHVRMGRQSVSAARRQPGVRRDLLREFLGRRAQPPPAERPARVPYRWHRRAHLPTQLSGGARHRPSRAPTDQIVGRGGYTSLVHGLAIEGGGDGLP